MKVKLIAVTKPIELQNVEQLIEYAGRTCTATTNKTGQKTATFIKARMRQGHTSILEHASFTFEIEGISRSCLAQLTRHRIASYSVQSMRYVKMNQVQFVLPSSITNNNFTRMVFEQYIKMCQTVYKKLLLAGVSLEDARFVLPLATHTNLIMTMNLRSLLNFFEQRLARGAQWEIKELATAMKQIITEYVPSVIN